MFSRSRNRRSNKHIHRNHTNRIIRFDKKHMKRESYTKKEWNLVLFFSLILTGIIIFIGIVFPERFSNLTDSLFNNLIDKFSPI